MKRNSTFTMAVIPLVSVSIYAQIWFGTVRDIRTLQPIPNARVCTGHLGMVDLTCTVSESDGSFSVSLKSGSVCNIPVTALKSGIYVLSVTGTNYDESTRFLLSK